MIPLFVGYALLVWYLAARYRRTLLGFACTIAGTGLLVAIAFLHWLIGHEYPALFIQGMQILLYPYIVAVGGAGLFIASLPHRYPPGSCMGCGYNLAGLGYPVSHCPECGRVQHPTRVSYRASGVQRENLRNTDVTVISTAQAAPRTAGEQDQGGDEPEEHPADR